MLKNNRKMIIGRNFLFCLCIICLMFTAVGIGVEDSFAVELNDTVGEISLESDNAEQLENSQNNEMLEVNSQDGQDLLGVDIKPKGSRYTNIQDALDSANDGDTIKLSGTYYSDGKFVVVRKKVNIIGDSTATLDGRHMSIAIDIKSAAAGTVLKNIKFINGKGTQGSAVYIEAKNVKIENCIFEDNHANKCGAVHTEMDLNTVSGLVVDNCEFRRNNCYFDKLDDESSGAGLTMYGINSEVKNSIFEDNWVKSNVGCYGGAIQVGLDLPGSNAKVTNCVFKNNQAISTKSLSHGGAGCVRQGSSYTNCIFINNCADQGGALTFHASGTLKNCTFVDNRANVFGGALSTGFLYDYMVMNVIDCNFEGNTAPKGGAIQANGLNILIDNTNFKNNKVSQNGGAINIKAQEVTVKNSIFNSNIANVDGGAIFIDGINTAIEGSQFVSNEAIPDADKLEDGLGGAIYVNSNLANIKNNVFKYNTARNGSAIYYDRLGEKLTLENNEFSQNQAWVYHLPIFAEDIYYGDNETIKVVLYGGNNIADFDNLEVSNAIYNAANNFNIQLDNQYPLNGATNSGYLYQDGREYNIHVLLKVQHEDGTTVYDGIKYTNYLGEITLNFEDLKPGKYFVSALHNEDNYYKSISNVTTFVVKPKVDNEVTKRVSNEIANFEDIVTWTITIKNNGPNNSTGVIVSDVLPKGVIWVNDTSNGKYDHNSGILNLSTLNAGETFSFDIKTIMDATGEMINKVNVTSNEFDTNTTNNFAEKRIFVNPAADLSVEKSVSNTNPNYKDNVVWSIKISNNGPDAAHDIKMFDLLPKSLIFIGCDGNYDNKKGIWDVGTLESGESITLNIQCSVNSTGMIENIVKVNATEYDYDLTNNNDSERIFVNPAVDLSIIKTANASNVNFNDVVKWTLTVLNNGPDIATNVKVLDELPYGFTYLDSALAKGRYVDGIFVIDTIAPGETVIIDIFTIVEDTGDAVNFVNVSSDEYDYNLTNNEDEKEIFVNPAADLSVSKSVSNPNPVYGEIITWTIEVINNGPDVAHDITLIDLIPNSLIWISDDSFDDYDHVTGKLVIDELDIEESYILNIECIVNATGSIQNNVSVSAGEYDYNLTNNNDSETIDVEKSADVSVIKLVNVSSPNYKDLVKWTLIISNNGPDKATNVYVEDELPEGMSLVNYTATKGIYDNGIWAMCCLNKGDSETLEIICRVDKTGKISNFAAIHADEYDFDESNNNDSKSIDVPPAVDLEVVIDVNNTNPIFGDNVNWIISVKNNGPDNATEVILKDFLPNELIFTGFTATKGMFDGMIWGIGELNAGNSAYLNISTISNGLGIIPNNVSVDASEYDWNRSNNVDDSLIDVRPIADLSIIKLVNEDSPNYGDKVKWTLIVSNNGPNAAHNVNVEDILPEGLKFISSNGDYSNNIWKIGTLNIGEEKSIEIICKVVSTGNFNNHAKIWADELDLDQSNNHASESINVAPASDLAITKIASRYTYRMGDVIEYVIEVVNNGPDTAKNIKITEMFDDLLKLKSFKLTKGKFDKVSKVWTIKSLGYGESAKIVIKVIATGSGIIKNAVKVTSDTFDFDKSNNNDFAVVNVTKKSSEQLHHYSKNKLNEKMQSNLQMHPTANPFMILVVSALFFIIFLGNNISKKR